jgi:hypothetical protein
MAEREDIAALQVSAGICKTRWQRQDEDNRKREKWEYRMKDQLTDLKLKIGKWVGGAVVIGILVGAIGNRVVEALMR